MVASQHNLFSLLRPSVPPAGTSQIPSPTTGFAIGLRTTDGDTSNAAPMSTSFSAEPSSRRSDSQSGRV